ncbi:MAG: preprotein translocase subunit SecE [Lachnospiraceae bacterium]|nr:preprotein translocase subunit SecE [Lachnospiraceae bacterium]
MADSAEKTKKQSFFKNVQIELKKISWPDKKTMFKQSVAVVAISVVAGVIIAIIDFVALNGVNFLTSL